MRLTRCAAQPLTGQQARGRTRWLALGVSTLAALLLFPLLLSPSPASASTLPDCLARQHVCVTGDGRSLVSEGQQSQLEQQIGGDGIYVVVAPSGPTGYSGTMNQIIAALSRHPQFTVGFLDSRLKHFGAYSKGMLPSGGAAETATRAVDQHRADQNVFAALTDFVTDVQDQAGRARAAPRPARRRTRCATWRSASALFSRWPCSASS